jgi:tetratricopeptide (TPR) repeat protein
MPASYWKLLDIEPTSSEADIRRAYAVRLRVTNPEDDPDGFKALRQAYEYALGHARYAQQYPPRDAEADGDDPLDDDLDDEVDDDEGSFLVPPPFTMPGSAPGPAHEDADAAAMLGPLEAERLGHSALCQRLIGVLEGNRSADACLAAFNEVVASPAMQHVDVFTATESWIAHTLIRSRPASDPLIEPAVKIFGWGDERVGSRNGVTQHILYLRERLHQEQRANVFLERLKDRRHEYHKAWKETMRPPSQRGLLNKLTSLHRTGRVLEFLQYAHDRYPTVFESLNREAVAWWPKRAPIGRSISRVFLVAIVVGLLVGTVALVGSVDPGKKSLSRPTQITAVYGAPPPPVAIDPEVLEAQMRSEARRDCREAVEQLGATAHGIQTFATTRAEVACKRVLEMTPDSLLMRQFAGIAALRLEQPEVALEHFDIILNASPDDAYALFGRGLVTVVAAEDAGIGNAKDLSDALAMNPDVAGYFESFSLFAPGVEPSRRKPRSRMPKPEGVRADTKAEQIDNPDGRDGDALASYFGLDDSTAGTVVVECIISAEGRATDCHVASEEPPNVGLGEVGLLAMEDVRYRPPTLDGKPIGGLGLRYTLTYNTTD